MEIEYVRIEDLEHDLMQTMVMLISRDPDAMTRILRAVNCVQEAVVHRKDETKALKRSKFSVVS